MNDIQPSDFVRLKSKVKTYGDKRGIAKVVSYLTGIEGGVLLDRQLGGFQCWNVADLKRAR